MIAEAIEKILKLSPVRTYEQDGRVFTPDNLKRIKDSDQIPPTALEFNTLTGLVDFFDAAIIEDVFFLHILSYRQVDLIGSIQSENDNARFLYATANCGEVPFPFNQWQPLENFIVQMMSMFVVNDAMENLLAYIGNIAHDTQVGTMDDGVTQKIQVRSGVTTKENVTIENPITLRPYRTFREADQPESDFVFRIKNGNGPDDFKCALYTADGDKWKLDAIHNIKSWLEAAAASNVKILA